VANHVERVQSQFGQIHDHEPCTLDPFVPLGDSQALVVERILRDGLYVSYAA
jgi:hypothetical protein